MGELARDAPSGLSRAHGGAERTEFLGFRLNDSFYAAPIALVREILRVPTITEVPRAPKSVMGITSVRGALVTLVDLRLRLNLPAPPATRRSRVLLVDVERELLGLFVDEVNQVYRLAASEIEIAATALGGDVAEQVIRW